MNQRACESLGYTRVELLTLSTPDIDTVWTGERITEAVRHLVPGTPVTAESTQRRKDGKLFPLRFAPACLRSLGPNSYSAWFSISPTVNRWRRSVKPTPRCSKPSVGCSRTSLQNYRRMNFLTISWRGCLSSPEVSTDSSGRFCIRTRNPISRPKPS